MELRRKRTSYTNWMKYSHTFFRHSTHNNTHIHKTTTHKYTHIIYTQFIYFIFSFPAMPHRFSTLLHVSPLRNPSFPLEHLNFRLYWWTRLLLKFSIDRKRSQIIWTSLSQQRWKRWACWKFCWNGVALTFYFPNEKKINKMKFKLSFIELFNYRKNSLFKSVKNDLKM